MRTPRCFFCLDCNVNTCDIDEYYTLHDHIWLAANPKSKGMLCIGCLEARLGRIVTRADFRPEVPINQLELNNTFPKSSRLIDRLSRILLDKIEETRTIEQQATNGMLAKSHLGCE
jgi:hypothetical protein